MQYYVIDVSVQRRFLVGWRNVPAVVAVRRHLEVWRHCPIFDLGEIIRINGDGKEANERVKNS